MFMTAAGTVPEWANGFKVGTFSRVMTSNSGDVAYTGVGFKPSMVIFIVSPSTQSANLSLSIGFDNITAAVCGTIIGISNYASDNSHSIYAYYDTGKYQTGIIKTFDSDGFTITWVKNGAADGTFNIQYVALR
jgi:hypothetical protein